MNTGARSLHVVRQDKPKGRRGWSQKGTGAGTGCHPSPVMDTQRYRRTERTSPMRVNRTERGKPVALLCTKGKKAVRPPDGGAGRGVGKSDGRPGVGRIRVAT